MFSTKTRGGSRASKVLEPSQPFLLSDYPDLPEKLFLFAVFGFVFSITMIQAFLLPVEAVVPDTVVSDVSPGFPDNSASPGRVPPSPDSVRGWVVP